MAGWCRSQVDNLVTSRSVPDSPRSASGIPRTDSPSVTVASLPGVSNVPAGPGSNEGATGLTEKEREKNLYSSRVLLTSALSRGSVLTHT